jgi:hypothetical protein
MLATILLYGVPALTIVVTLYVGFLGWRFYVAEVIRGGDR